VLKSCEVSFKDTRGVTHAVEVAAETLFEAAATALAIFRRDGWTDALGTGTKLAIEVREPVVKHELSVRQIQAWLEGATTSPSERVRKDRLRGMLGS
jgi:hypothetical protein